MPGMELGVQTWMCVQGQTAVNLQVQEEDSSDSVTILKLH